MLCDTHHCVGKQAVLYTAGGSLNWYDICQGQFGNEFEIPLKTYILTEPVVPLLGISPIKTLALVHIDVHGKMFTEALFVIAKIMEEKFINKELVR